MIAVLASVHHTGTNFIFQHLLEGWHQVGMNPESIKQVRGKTLVRMHCDMDQSPYIPFWRSHGQLIVPMRNPYKVAESWVARGKDLKWLGKQWECLRREVDPYEPAYVPLDSPDREQWLEAASELLETKLQTDWPVIMSVRKAASLTEYQREQVRSWTADGFFDQFGYEV